MKEKKPVPKWLKIVLAVALSLLALVIIIGIFGPDPEDTDATSDPSSTSEVVPAREDAIGKSDKDADDLLGGYKPHNMLNDATGKWKLTTYASPDGNVETYAVSYYNKYFSSSDEVHWLVNFTNQTTTCIKNLSGILFVDVYEYVENEEHDANKIGGGQPLASYQVHLDNGDIEKVS